MKTITFSKKDETDYYAEFPSDVENRLRKLCDDDRFVDMACAVLVAYYEMRSMELIQVSLEDAKLGAKRVLKAVETLQHEMKLCNAVSFLPRNYRALDDIKSGYSAHLGRLKSISGRQTKQGSLRGLAGSLLNLFNTYGVDDEKLNQFIESTLPAISPGGDIPCLRTIQTAVSKARN